MADSLPHHRCGDGRRTRRLARRRLVPGVLVAAALLAGCAPARTLGAAGERVRVVATNGLLADLTRTVGGDRVDVVSLVPDGADPHVHEPSLRDVRNVVFADLAVRNGLLLEPQVVTRALDANLPDTATDVALAEEAARRGASVIPLVEDRSLDTPWLGMRVHGAVSGVGDDAEVVLRALGVDGPGKVLGYVTGTFGEPTFHIGAGEQTTVLPPGAHTHMSWAFTEPGVHRLRLAAELRTSVDAPPVRIAQGTIVFAVGVDPSSAATGDSSTLDVVDRGHADVGVDLDTGQVRIFWDADGGGAATQRSLDPASTVVEVPNRALHDVPSDPAYRRLGRAGQQVHQLPQAVLGAHVHGQVDPHLWQDVTNTITYVEVLRDALIGLDPDGAATYRRRTADYVRELEALDRDLRETVASLPPSSRHLVTTHDAFGYLADAYGLEVSGFVTPNPSSEPSMADRRRLASTIRNLSIPAVFLEPTAATRTSTLTQVAVEEGVRVCPIHGDTFVDPVDSYVEMMRANAASLRDCLGAR